MPGLAALSAGSWKHHPAPEYLLLYISILWMEEEQSCPTRHLKVDEKNEGRSQRFQSGHMFLNHCLIVEIRGETCMTFPVGRGLPQKSFLLLTLLSVTAEPVT